MPPKGVPYRLFESKYPLKILATPSAIGTFGTVGAVKKKRYTLRCVECPIINIFSSKMYSIDYAREKSFVSL